MHNLIELGEQKEEYNNQLKAKQQKAEHLWS